MNYILSILILLFLPFNLYSRTYNFKEAKQVAIIYIINNNHGKALKILNEYKNNNPGDYRIYLELSEAYINIKNYTHAINNLLAGIEEAPDYKIRFYYKLGLIYYTLLNYEKSIAYLKQIPEKMIEQNYIDSYKFIGLSYFLLSEYRMTIKYLNKYLKINKINYKDQDIYNYLAMAYLNIGNKNYYQIFYELDNLLTNNKNISYYDYIYKKGLLFLKYKKPEDAVNTLLNIHRLRKKDYKLNFNIGLAYSLINEYDEAVLYLKRSIKYYNKKFSLPKIFKKLLRLDETGAKYLLVLSINYVLNNQKKKAMQTFKQIKQYSSTIYKKYKLDYIKGKKSKLYNELEDLWEY